MQKKLVTLAAAAALLAGALAQPAKAGAEWLWLFPGIPIGSVLVNDIIMFHCQHRLLTWQEVPPSLIPIYSQAQLLNSGACPRPAPAR
jgi:hypothetical protein